MQEKLLQEPRRYGLLAAVPRISADGICTLGASQESQPTQRKARKGTGPRKSADEDGDVGECQQG